MKKILLLLGIFYSFTGYAQVQSVSEGNPNTLLDEEFFSMIEDMKIFHDRVFIQSMILGLYEQEQNAEDVSIVTSGIFNETDAAILNKTMEDKKLRYTITPELLAKADAAPFEAFKELVQTAVLPQINASEIEKLNQVDKKAISRMQQMITESGPDIGAKSVAITYNEAQE